MYLTIAVDEVHLKKRIWLRESNTVYCHEVYLIKSISAVSTYNSSSSLKEGPQYCTTDKLIFNIPGNFYNLMRKSWIGL